MATDHARSPPRSAPAKAPQRYTHRVGGAQFELTLRVLRHTIADDADEAPTTRLTAERDLLKLQLTFARSFMDVLMEDACRLSDDLSNGLTFEAPQSGATIWPGA
jgi:hypothetical protein